MLDLSSWQQHTTNLEHGRSVRVDHTCGPGRTMTVRRTDDGYSAYCFRCSLPGWLPLPPEPLAVRLARMQKQQQADDKVCQSVELPAPAVREWDKWPAPCRLWLLKAGLSRADLPKLGAYYHPPTNRVVLPVLDPLLGPLFWQARAVDGRQPKYLAPGVDKATVIPRYGKAQHVTLTEDMLSAYKVGKVAEGWAMLGTSISKHAISLLSARGCKVNIWLDPDKAGRRAATKVAATLRSVGVECDIIRSTVDPKLVHSSDIKELLA